MTAASLRQHFDSLATALEDNAAAVATMWGWSETLVSVFDGGGRLLACGNGGSAAEAQHLTAELRTVLW